MSTETTPPGGEVGNRQMFRYTVPVDDQPHAVHLTSDPLHMDAFGSIRVVEFWAEHDASAQPALRVFQVFGTGHPLPPGARYAGTAPRTALGLVWHLYELCSDESGVLAP